MPIERDRQDEDDRHRHVGELERRGDVGERDRDLGPEGDHRERHERRHRGDHGSEDEHQLVGGLRDDVFLQRQLHAVGEALQQAEGTVDVRADAVLHPGHHAPLEPDVEQRQQHEHDEDQHGLEDHQPGRVVPEGTQALGGGQGCRLGDQVGVHLGASRDRDGAAGRADEVPDRCPGGARRRPHGALGEVRHTDREIDRTERAAQGDHVTDAGAEVGQRGGTDQHDGLASGRPHGLVAVLHPAVVDQLLPGGEDQLAGSPGGSRRERQRPSSKPPIEIRSPSHGPTWTISSQTCSEVRQPRGAPSSSAIPARTRRSGSELGLCSTLPN